MNQKAFSDRRWYDCPVIHSPKCNYCIHYLGMAKCKAFTERIPNKIIDKNDEATESFICNPNYDYSYIAKEDDSKRDM